MKIFKERLKELRIENNLHQHELASALEIGPASISHYENGIRNPDLKTLLKISKLFNVSVDYLLGETVYRQYPSADILSVALNAISNIEKTAWEAKHLIMDAIGGKGKGEEPEQARERLQVSR